MCLAWNFMELMNLIFKLIRYNTVTGRGLPILVYGGAGGGVCNYGVFEIYGGKISNNIVSVFREQSGGGGGGVYNSGTFTMSGGEISNNTARTGGGVFNEGTFEMSGGKVTNNESSIHSMDGGGVFNGGNFIMSGGTIANNQAHWGFGSGVTNMGNFTMFGGKITNNKGGSGVYNFGTFIWVGGAISNNAKNNVANSGEGNVQYKDGSLMDLVIVRVGVMALIFVVMLVLLFYFSSKAKPAEEKLDRHVDS
jgi:hypothetical protein